MSLYLLLLGRQELPHHYILSVQASLAQPDFQLVGHSDTQFAPPRCFPWCLRANRCCQTLPGTLFPGFLPRPLVLPLWAPWEQAPEPHCLTPRQMPAPDLFRKSSDPGNLRAYSRFLQVGHQNPAHSTSSCHSHKMPTTGTSGVSSSGKGTSLTLSTCQNTAGKGLPPLSVWFWGRFLLYVSPFLSNSSTDALPLKSHLYCFGLLSSRLQT